MSDLSATDLKELVSAADAAGAQLARVCGRLAIALEVPRSELDHAVEYAVEAGRRLREAMSNAAEAVAVDRQSWGDRESLTSIVETLSGGLERLAQARARERLRALAEELRAGVIVDPKASRRQHLEKLRLNAVHELDGALEGETPMLPWPARRVESVIAWLAAEEGVSEKILPLFPALANFITVLEATWWKPPFEPPASVADAPEGNAAVQMTSEAPELAASLPPVEDMAPSAPVPHRIDVMKVRQAMRTAPTVGLPESVAPPPADQEGDLTARRKGPRFVAAAALIPASAEERRLFYFTKPLDGKGAVAADGKESANQGDPDQSTPHDADDLVAGDGVVTEPGLMASSSAIEVPSRSPHSSELEARLSAEPSIAPGGASTDAEELSVGGELVLSTRPPVRMLPSELASMKAFRTAFWRDEKGQVVRAPWGHPDFERVLETSAGEALYDGRFGHLMLFARAGEALGVRTCPVPNDVRVVVGLLGGPRTAPAESEARRTRLEDLMSNGRLPTSLAARLAIFLEAVTQSPLSPLAASKGRAFAEASGFSNPMVNVLEAFLVAGSAEDDPVARVRAALQKLPKLSAEELEKAATCAEEDLHAAVKTMWSAAGGRIGTAHSREAWLQFMAKAQPVFKELIDKKTWDDLKRLDGLLQEYTRIAEKAEVRFGDRHRMDRAAGDLVLKARAIITARREAGRRSRAVQGRGLSQLVEAYRKLPAREALSGNDACFVNLLDRLLRHQGTADENIGSFPVAEIYRRPALLECLPSLALTEDRWIDATAIAEPLSAAAHMIYDSEANSDASVSLARHLRDIGREDLLTHIEPRSDTDAKFATDAFGKTQGSTTRGLAQARSAVVALDELAHPAAPNVRNALDEAERILVDGLVQEATPEFLLAWVECLHRFARSALEESMPGLREAFLQREPTADERLRFEHAVRQKRHSEMLSLARGEGDAPVVNDRATLWRRTAAMEFPEPRRTLQQLRSRHVDLCHLWLQGIRGSGADDALRHAFVKFVFDTITLTKNNIKEPKGRRETQVGMDPVRTAMARLGLNPSFVPQVTAFRDISVITPNAPPSENTFVRSTSELLAKATEGRITVILAPAISTAVRDQLREEMRKGSRKGVGIIDDLDLVRLVNPGRQEPNPILGLLEIVLEQQPKWSPVNPFESHEGQHTKPEMFVGRKQEAEELSQQARYSRVFSGRRLGKSALLKHVHDSQEKAKLPSGNRLRVVYVPIVGLDSEDAVVRKVIGKFSGIVAEPPAGTPAERLNALVESYLQKEKKGSVLVFLDEADTFVEAQIKQYERDLERSLTWRMRSELEHERDSHDLPRVRFVFAGYRATHRLEGAWANWGDVLRLRPLSPADAARLIAGPLTRMGIDVASEAVAIAYRCGYQPAILVRFGQQLIEYLDATLTPARRDAVVVSSEQVATVYQRPAVQQEIRTIVWNNFQGNPFGQIVFSALLLEFARMPPGAALDDTPSRVLQRLRSLVPSFMTDESLDGPAVDRIARTLRDFVDRSLIGEVHATTRSYRLRFPHQLNVLLQEDQEAIIRREALALGGERLDAIEEVRSLVPRGSLEDIAYAVANEGFVAGVVASHWLEAVKLRAANVATRLGYLSGEIVNLSKESGDSFDPKLRRLALMAASPDVAARALEARNGLEEEEHPLILGGLDLLRWGLRRSRAGRDVELAAVPRLSAVQLRWWFERVCAINWSGANPARLFIERTGGIPYLVAQLDRELAEIVGHHGASASDTQVQQACEAYERRLDRAARELVTGDQTIALNRREAELLVMVSLASSLASEAPADKQLSDLMGILVSPGDYAELIPGLERYKSLAADDAVSLDVLLRCGLLVSEPRANSTDPFERLHVLPPADPARRIATMVERCLST